MLRNSLIAALIAGCLAVVPGLAEARVSVQVWTDRGEDAVYKPGDLMQIKVRPSGDAYLLVYEIDTEGYVHVLFPERGQDGMVDGRSTLYLPDQDSDQELVVEKETGEGYVVAIASEDPFRDLPWYLRPYDSRTEGVDYEGQPDDEDGLTADGQIVGDPFVAMERIRRRVLRAPGDAASFGTAYASYYVHERVRYPRYMCYDCHRPDRWAWWDDFDPYYTTCSVVDFRINWGWSWGPTYWFGNVPYFCYVPRADCPPHWRRHWDHPWYSSWDGWNRWNLMWGGPLVRHKTPPPPGYTPPSAWSDPNHWRGRDAVPMPPGYIADRGVPRDRRQMMLPVGRNRPAGAPDVGAGGRATPPRPVYTGRSPAQRMPAGEVRPEGGGGSGGRVERPREERRMPAGPQQQQQREGRQQPAPAQPPREERHGIPSAPPQQQPREERRQQPAPAQPPREERRGIPSAPPQQQREERRQQPAPAQPPSDRGGDRDRGGR